MAVVCHQVYSNLEKSDSVIRTCLSQGFREIFRLPVIKFVFRIVLSFPPCIRLTFVGQFLLESGLESEDYKQNSKHYATSISDVDYLSER